MKLSDVDGWEEAAVANPIRQIAIQTDRADPVVWECAALARFWRRRAFFCFVPAECPNGEQDWSIDHEHLEFALQKVKHYDALLANRIHEPEAIEVK
jgi:hypothetical protein